MTSDDFIAGLRADWRHQPIDLARIRSTTLRRRLWQELFLLVSLAGTVGALLLGLWFVWRAFTERDALTAVGAVALLVSVPVLLLEYIEGRRSNRTRYDETPQGVLEQARRQLEFSKGLQRGCRLSSLILGSAAVAALLLGLFGASEAPRAFTTAATWGGTAAALWLWGAWRRRRLDREAARCEQLLAEIGSEDGA